MEETTGVATEIIDEIMEAACESGGSTVDSSLPRWIIQDEDGFGVD